MAEAAFNLFIPDTDLEFLCQKPRLTRFPDELKDADWDYGVPLADIKRLAARWENDFDWRRFEAEVNKIPQFTRATDIVGHGSLNIHYVHQRSELTNAIPLSFVHGCEVLSHYRV